MSQRIQQIFIVLPIHFSSTNDPKIDGNVPLDSSKNDSIQKLRQDELNKQGPSKEEYKTNLSSKASLLEISSTSHTIRKKRNKKTLNDFIM